MKQLCNFFYENNYTIAMFVPFRYLKNSKNKEMQKKDSTKKEIENLFNNLINLVWKFNSNE